MSGRLWDKGLSMDQKILEFTVGSDYLLDARLVQFDVQASIAHAQMLGHCGHLQSAEVTQLTMALGEILSDFELNNWQITLQDEDCHTAIEGQLMPRLGGLGGKIHLGRSRNDQVLVALRLYLRATVGSLAKGVSEVQKSLEDLAESEGQIAIPGYTHMQQAMPSSVSDWANGFITELGTSAGLLNAADQLASINPLGSAAGYGTPGLTLDRDFTTELLKMSTTQSPATACQLSRGKAEATLAFAITQILNDLGRLAADICLFATQEFAIVKLEPDISTGSSIMPQKRNPDVFELIRAHSTQAASDLQAILALTSKLSSGYHRDMQLIKEPLFRLIDRAEAVLEISAYALQRIHFDADRAAAITHPAIHQAEAAFRLVQSEGLSFREAYRKVATQSDSSARP